MFTGIVRDVGVVCAASEAGELRRLSLTTSLPVTALERGASVALDGVCLTVVAAEAGRFSADAAFETLRRTTLGQLAVGARVNLEPALRVGDALGGHLVSGHVDGVGRIQTLSPRGEALEVAIEAPAELLPLVAVKGSITVSGVSLTVNAVDDHGFAVGLIPHTLAVTTFSGLRPGQAVNLEVDLVARYLARLVGRPDLGDPPRTRS